MAANNSIANLLLRVTGQNSDAKRALDEVEARLTLIAQSHATATVDINSAAAKRQLAEVETALDLIGRRRVSAHVKVEVDDARAKLNLLRRELSAAGQGIPGARPIQSIVEDIAKLGAEIPRIVGLGGRLASMGSSIGESFQGMGSSILKGGVAMIAQLGAQIAMLTVMMVALVPVVQAVLGVLGLLVTLAAGAAAGIALLATAFIGMLVPVLGVVVGLFAAVAKAVKDAKDADEQAKKSTEELARAQESRAAAADRLRAAQEQQSQAYRDGLRAQRDAVDDVKNAELARESALLGIEDAKIRTERAKEALRDFGKELRNTDLGSMFKRFQNVDYRLSDRDLRQANRAVSGSKDLSDDQKLDLRELLQDVRRAELGEREAKQRVKDSTDTLNDARQKEAEFLAKGVAAYEPYRQAIASTAEAQKALSKANAEYADKQADLTKAQDKQQSSSARLGRQLRRIFDDIKEAFGPPVRIAMKGLLDFFESFAETMQDTGIQRGLRNIGRALAEVFRGFGRLLEQREVREIFADLANAAARLVRVAGGGFRSFVLLFLRLARAASPYLIDFFTDVARALRGWERGSRDANRLNSSVGRIYRTLRIVLGIVKDLTRLFLAFFTGSRDQADDFGNSIRRVLQRWTRFLESEEGQRRVREFLKEAVDTAKALWQAFVWVVETLRTMYNVAKDVWGVIEKIANNPIVKVATGAAKGGLSILEAPLIAGSKLLQGDIKGSALAAAAPVTEPLKALGGLLGLRGRATGGFVPGFGGRGDDTLMALEGGEFVIRRAAAQALGPNLLHALNTGASPGGLRVLQGAGGGGSRVEIYAPISAPPATYPSPEWVAKKLTDLASKKGK